MRGGLRYENVLEMPPGMREQVVVQVVAKVSAQAERAEKEDPCIECLRWWKCNGVDSGCPFR